MSSRLFKGTVPLSLLFLFVLFASSCKSGENRVGKLKKRTVSFLEKKIDSQAFEADQLAGRMKVKHFKNGKKQQGFTADFRLQRDNKLWVSINVSVGIKIEVARALIEKDRVQVLDKFNKRYYDKPFNYIHNFIEYPLEFEDLQEVIWGNPIFRKDYDDVAIAGDQYHLNSENSQLFLDYQYRLVQMLLADPAGAGAIDAKLNSYEELDNSKWFAKNRVIELKSKDDFRFELDFSRLSTTEPLSFPFTVSSKYDKVD